MYQGGVTPTITAKTISGAAVEWLVIAPPAAQSYMMITFGIVSGTGPESTHSFAINSNPTETPPGTYTATVTAYYSGHLSSGITKTVTIHVLSQPTFKLLTSPTGPYSIGTQTCVPFEIQWSLPAGTTAQPISATAAVT